MDQHIEMRNPQSLPDKWQAGAIQNRKYEAVVIGVSAGGLKAGVGQ